MPRGGGGGRHGRRRSGDRSPAGRPGRRRNRSRSPGAGRRRFRFGRCRGGRNFRFYTYGRWGRCDGDRRYEDDVAADAPEPDAATLKVKSVDLKILENCKAHNTWKYEICNQSKNPQLVVRRGQPFDIDITFSREYDAKRDDLKLVFEAGDKPNPTKGTSVEVILSDKDEPKKWGAKIVTKKGDQLTVSVFTPPTLYVGQWDLSIEVIKRSGETVDVYTYEHENPIYILFNPWCKDDQVYLDDENLMKEYIWSDTGKIYCGSARNVTSRPWNFGQFDSCILDAALYLLDAGELAWTSRGNPIPVVRKMSAMVNSNDDGGVLVGNWSGEYSDGKSPLAWTGSVAILEKYWNDKKRPVKFGQCWVFSGVCTTVCRALGIPTRSVTNFASAHDTDGSVTIDVIFNEEGDRDDYMTDDSVWNFHVWNEAWMARPDLPTGFGGWQAFDATPQELSEGIFCCGPVSVQAIKQGEINLPHDGPFVFAEVNADRMYWMPNTEGKLECLGCDQRTVGKFISTKEPNSWRRLDLTNTYKPPEGSAEERAAVLKANQLGSSRTDLYDHKKHDVKFSIEQDSENTWVGGDFEVCLRMKNESKQGRTVSGRINVSSMYYTGVVATKLKSDPFKDITLRAGQEVVQKVVVTSKEYDGKLKDCCMLDLSVWAVVKETNQHFTAKEDFRLRKPHLTIKAPEVVKAATEFQVEVSFTNPLDSPLTACFLAVDGLTRPLEFPQGNVNAKGTFMTTLPITPKKLGHTELIVSFNALQLEDINGSHPIFIQDK